jgi:hypothetical protein
MTTIASETPLTRGGWLAVRAAVLVFLAGLGAFALWAGATDYGLRVTSDTPTFIALLEELARRPFAPQSPFLAHGDVATQHATPYMQALALLYEHFGVGDGPVAVGRFLASSGLAVFAATLVALFAFARRYAGELTAWLSLPAVLLVFGPPHVIWASDMTLHGALYAGYYPQLTALALLLATLLLIDYSTYGSLALACVTAGATMVIHPLTGIVLCGLAVAESLPYAYRREVGYARASLVLAAGFVLGLAWPAYSLDRAFSESGLRGLLLVPVLCAVPFVVRVAPRVPLPRFGRLADALCSRASAVVLAAVGLVGTITLALWAIELMGRPNPDPLVRSNRLALYCV